MNRRLLGAVALTGVLTAGCGLFGDDAERQAAVISANCVDCHNPQDLTGDLDLASLSLSLEDVHSDAETWEKVLVKLRTGAMPPVGVPRPDRATYDRVIGQLESTIDGAAGPVFDPGRPLLHRMNRAEYQNALRDLLALDIDVTPLLPADDSSYGFDNIADVLGVSPALQERYLSAADMISALAVGVAGSTSWRRGPAMNSGCSLPAPIWPMMAGAVAKKMSIWPPTKSATAKAVPRYGTCVRFMPERTRSSSPAKCCWPPVPGEP